MHAHNHTAPPYEIHLINDSPRVVGDTVEVDFTLSKPASDVTCWLGTLSPQNCEFNYHLLSKLYLTDKIICLRYGKTVLLDQYLLAASS